MGIVNSKYLFEKKTDTKIFTEQPRYYCKKCKAYFTLPSIVKPVVEADTNTEPSVSESCLSSDATVKESASEVLMDIQPEGMPAHSCEREYTIAVQTDSWIKDKSTNTSISFLKLRRKRKSLWLWWPWSSKRSRTSPKSTKVLQSDKCDAKASIAEESHLNKQSSSTSKDSNKKITFSRTVSLVHFDSSENITNEADKKRSFTYALQQQKTQDLSDSSYDLLAAHTSSKYIHVVKQVLYSTAFQQTDSK